MKEGLSKALEAVRDRLIAINKQQEALSLEKAKLKARESALDALRIDPEGCLLVKKALNEVELK